MADTHPSWLYCDACMGTSRDTTGLICETCGGDYSDLPETMIPRYILELDDQKCTAIPESKLICMDSINDFERVMSNTVALNPDYAFSVLYQPVDQKWFIQWKNKETISGKRTND